MGPNVFERKIFLTNFWNKQKGSINLFTIRHDQGQIRHVFKPDSSIVNGVEPASPQGHSSISPVSVLTLDSIDESSFLSGGWDGRILVSLFLSCSSPQMCKKKKPQNLISRGFSSFSNSLN